MYVRVSMVEGPPERYDDAVKVINERAVPAVRQVPGLVAAYWAVDREAGEVVTFAIFDTLEALNASEEQARAVREASVQELGGTVVSVKTYEIVGQT